MQNAPPAIDSRGSTMERSMQRFLTVVGYSVLLLGAFARPASAELLVSEYQTSSVVDVEAGGDFAGAERYATGLLQPDGLCFGPNAEIYVAELIAGEVTIITGGGDFADAEPFATGLDAPSALVCASDQILVLERDSREITDITDGGDFTGAPAWATVPTFGVDMVRDSAGTLWFGTFPFFGGSIYDATAGGAVGGLPPYAQVGQALFSLAETSDGRLLASTGFVSGNVLDWTDGGGEDVFATGLAITHMLGTADAVWASTGDALYDIVDGGEIGELEPFATGLGNGALYETYDILHIPVECGNHLVQAGESCDVGGGETADCDDDCSDVACGDGTINVTAGEACDDGNTDDGDGCSATCVEEPGWGTSTGGESSGDHGSSGDEDSSGGHPGSSGGGETGVGESGPSATTSSSTGSPPATTGNDPGDSSSGEETSGGIPQLDLGDACACTSGGGNRGLPVFLFVLLGVGRLRRRINARRC